MPLIKIVDSKDPLAVRNLNNIVDLHEVNALTTSRRWLAGHDVARQYPLPSAAAKAHRQHDGEDLERWEGVELARDAAACQAWAGR